MTARRQKNPFSPTTTNRQLPLRLAYSRLLRFLYDVFGDARSRANESVGTFVESGRGWDREDRDNYQHSRLLGYTQTQARIRCKRKACKWNAQWGNDRTRMLRGLWIAFWQARDAAVTLKTLYGRGIIIPRWEKTMDARVYILYIRDSERAEATSTDSKTDYPRSYSLDDCWRPIKWRNTTTTTQRRRRQRYDDGYTFRGNVRSCVIEMGRSCICDWFWNLDARSRNRRNDSTIRANNACQALAVVSAKNTRFYLSLFFN